MNNLKNALPYLLAAVVLAGCPSTQQTVRKDERGERTETRRQTGGAQKSSQEDNVPQINAKAKMAFEDANKSYAQAKQTGKWDYVMLERKYRAAADADPNLAEATYDLGVLAERQGKMKDAASYYNEALEKKPSLHQAAENLAVMAQNSGDEARAVEIYTKVLASYPEDAGSRARLAEINRRKGDYDKAIQLSKEALFREPKTLQAYKTLMLTYYAQKQFSLAKLVALRASKIEENDPEIFFTLGQMNLDEGDIPKARVQFKKAVEARPDYLPAHLQLAKIALKQENYPAAEESIRRILQADGKNAEAMVDLGIALKGMGQYDKAMQVYDDAQKLKPDLSAIYLNKGFVMLAKNEPEKAIELFKLYQSRSPENPMAADQGIKDAEAILQERADAKKAEEEAKKMEEEAKKAEEAAKAEEKKQKEEELKKQQEGAKTGGKDDKGAPAEPDAKKDTKPPAGKADAKAPEKKEEPVAKPPAPKKEEPKPAEKKAAPPPAAPKKDDEPNDSL